ncbi:hypothetical protein GCM10023350_35990 [Nocardioides endophyticus]|uniref:Uncharacterized protein n=1 Tax=Nocardioides endophyticus TaxID=1353775 RepID=A0ABP8Z6G5_9ACTN
MYDEDRDEWMAIEAGRRAPTWPSIVGKPEAAEYLTSQGRAVAAHLTSGMRAFLGDEWVAACMGFPDRLSVPVPTLARLSPVLSPYGPRAAFCELLRWWASVEFAKSKDVAGLGRLRAELRRDLKVGRLTHAMAQLRLGALAQSLGHQVQFESRVGSWPSDVLIETGAESLAVEIVTLFVEREFSDQSDAIDENMEFLRSLGSRYLVHWSGEVPGRLNRHEQSAWKELMRAAAELTASTHLPHTITDADRAPLIVTPGPEPVGTELVGPLLEADQGARAVAKIRVKAEQASAAPGAWIWVENHGLFQPFTPFERLPLAEKAMSFSGLVAQLLDDFPDLGGIVLSSASRRLPPLPDDRTEVRGRAWAYRRGLPTDRIRESILVRTRSNQPGLLHALCSAEGGFLDQALPALGFASRLDDLFQPDVAW